jgi:hypothetical protein
MLLARSKKISRTELNDGQDDLKRLSSRSCWPSSDEVVAISNAAELETAISQQKEFDLLITDVVFPAPKRQGSR